jgi:hypothetical protein
MGKINNVEQNSNEDRMVENLLPRWAINQPARGIEVSEPMATQSNVKPNVLLLREKRVWMLGNRVLQLV